MMMVVFTMRFYLIIIAFALFFCDIKVLAKKDKNKLKSNKVDSELTKKAKQAPAPQPNNNRRPSFPRTQPTPPGRNRVFKTGSRSPPTTTATTKVKGPSNTNPARRPLKGTKAPTVQGEKATKAPTTKKHSTTTNPKAPSPDTSVDPDPQANTQVCRLCSWTYRVPKPRLILLDKSCKDWNRQQYSAPDCRNIQATVGAACQCEQPPKPRCHICDEGDYIWDYDPDYNTFSDDFCVKMIFKMSQRYEFCIENKDHVARMCCGRYFMLTSKEVDDDDDGNKSEDRKKKFYKYKKYKDKNGSSGESRSSPRRSRPSSANSNNNRKSYDVELSNPQKYPRPTNSPTYYYYYPTPSPTYYYYYPTPSPTRRRRTRTPTRAPIASDETYYYYYGDDYYDYNYNDDNI